MTTRSFMTAEFIRAKRDGEVLDPADIKQFVDGIVSGAVSPEQISAFAMATFFKGMNLAERTAITLAMRDSGDTINWSDFGFDKDAPIVDKHSTGGVGDKVSLMLVPLVVACGGYVPMISGRGLGHTGGTLDKLQSIPGFNPFPSTDDFAAIVKTVGGAIIGQTARLAPADAIFYGIRDVTATVEIIPLITASILSKKLAAGLKALVMDIKVGSGAFMQTAEKAEELAESIIAVARKAGVPTAAMITDMNQVLGTTAGNAVEVQETIDFLTKPKTADPRLKELTLKLAATMAFLSGAMPSKDAAYARAETALADGTAAEIFARMVKAQGGPGDLLEKPDKYLTFAPVRREVLSDKAGFITQLEPRSLGISVIGLGGGRLKADDPVDHAVGFSNIAPLGSKVVVGDAIATLYARNETAALKAEADLRAVLAIKPEPMDTNASVAPIIYNELGI